MPYAYSPGVLSARDPFTGIAAGTALNGRTAPAGGSWTTLGAATDFLATDAPSGGETESRDTFGDTGVGRIAVISTSATNTEVGISLYVEQNRITEGDPSGSVVARYVDPSNYLAFSVSRTALSLKVVVAGATSTLASMAVTRGYYAWHTLRVVVFASGRVIGWMFNTVTGALLASLEAVDARLATGGALATGNPGFIDYNPSADSGSNPIRYFDDFYAATPAPEPIVIHSGRSIQFRHDGVVREDATGTYSGPPHEYVGGRFFVPPAGSAGRRARVAVIARRNDVMTMADDNIADSTTVQAFVTPRYLVVPRD
jgi:hypothetical protein